MMRNHPAVLASLFGLALAGCAWVPVNPEQRNAGLRYLVEHAGPRLVLVDEDHVAALRGCGADLSGIHIVVHGSAAAQAGGVESGDISQLADMLSGDAEFEEAPPSPHATFAIMYTSGTTGRPKGVVVTHAMLRYAGEAAILLADAHDGDVLFMWEPLYHIGGAQVLLMPLLRHLQIALVPRFSASRFWDQVREAGATHIHYLGGILQMLMKQPPAAADRQHGARTGWGAGCAKEHWAAVEARFGIRLREAYGMTETSSIATFNGNGTPGGVGHAVPWFDVSVIDDAGRPAPAGTQGEIVVAERKAGSLFGAYFRDPDATKAALRAGRLHTRDLGVINGDGELRFLGRMTDSMRCRGENVSAWEIEHVAAEHPAVDSCAAIGVAADVGEQDIKLFVRVKPGHALGAAALSQWLASRLTPYQNPRYIAFTDDFERTPSQRIMKHLLDKDVARCWDRSAQPLASSLPLPPLAEVQP